MAEARPDQVVSLSELGQLMGMTRQLLHYYLKMCEIPTYSMGGSGVGFVYDKDVAEIVSTITEYRKRPIRVAKR